MTSVKVGFAPGADVNSRRNATVYRFFGRYKIGHQGVGNVDVARIKDSRMISLREDIAILCKGLSVEACGRVARFASLIALVSLDYTMCLKIVDGSVCFTFTLLLAYSRI